MSEIKKHQSYALDKAVEFFAPVRRRKDFSSLMTKPSILRADTEGLITVILAEEKVSDALQQTLDDQKQNLLDICGLGVAYVDKQADTDKTKAYDTSLWQDVFNHLPLMSASKFSRDTFQQHLEGTEIALKFVEVIFESVVTEGASLTAFGNFLQGLGNSIKFGVDRGTKSYSVGAITIVLETLKIGNKVDIVPKLKGYFIDFTQKEQRWYSSCASHTRFDMSFDFRTAVSIFNYRALEDSEVSSKFKNLIHNSEIADIAHANNYFNVKVDR